MLSIMNAPGTDVAIAQPIELLVRSLKAGRLAHAYLLTGARLEALENVARHFAQAIQCEGRLAKSVEPAACGICDSCARVSSGCHPDVQWIRPESKLRVITIQQIRDLMQSLSLKPQLTGMKVAVLVAADRLNMQAANAFLKTLEEPPGDAVLLLLSTEPQRLLETIRSRCLRIACENSDPGGPREASLDWLREGLGGGEEWGGIIARYRLLGRLMTQLGTIRSDIERQVIEDPRNQVLEDADARQADRWRSEMAASSEAEYRRQRSEVLAAMQWWLRDVWIQAAVPGLIPPTVPGLRMYTEAVAARIGIERALENLSSLEQTQRLLGLNVQEALALEVGVLRLHL